LYERTVGRTVGRSKDCDFGIVFERKSAVLENVQDLKNLSYDELKLKSELRFGETHSLQNYYSQFTNRRQKFGEDVVSLGSDLERLSQLAYPECSQIIRDKIACAQFVSTLSDRSVSRTLQLEGIIFLRKAIEGKDN